MREDQPTGAAVFASPGKVVSLPGADSPHGQDHLTWAYQTHVTAIYQYIYSRVGNRPDAEDLTAQVFMKAISGMRSDVSVPELRSWLYRVAQTTLADHWREYYAEDTGELDDDVTRPPAPRENPEAVLRVATRRGGRRPGVRPSRGSRWLTGAAGIAAGGAAAVGIDRLATHPAPTANQPLVENGSWKAVKAVADLPEATPVAFRAGAIEGFLIRYGQEVKGLSAVCTHMGCILNYSKFRDQFECPCHGATFKKNGQATERYDTPLPTLPSLPVRVQRGQVEVYTA